MRLSSTFSNNNDYWSKIYFFAAFTNPSLVWSSRKKFSPVTYVTKFDLKSCIPLLPDGKNRIVVRSLILTHCHSAKDRRTDTPLMAKARVCITDARQNTRFCRITPKGNKMHAIMTIVWWYVSQPTSTWVLYCLKRCKIAASRKPCRHSYQRVVHMQVSIQRTCKRTPMPTLLKAVLHCGSVSPRMQLIVQPLSDSRATCDL